MKLLLDQGLPRSAAKLLKAREIDPIIELGYVVYHYWKDPKKNLLNKDPFNIKSNK